MLQRLPAGLCGVVFRHDEIKDRAALGRAVAKICKARRLTLVVAGDAKLAAALHAGLHLRGGRRGLSIPRGGCRAQSIPRGGCRAQSIPNSPLTASVHNEAQLRQARRAGAKILFISPVFPTASHPGGAVLGARGWRRLARLAGAATPGALGGMDLRRMRALGRACTVLAGIEMFLPNPASKGF